MKSLIIVAHGSRLAEANQEVAALTANIERNAPTEYSSIRFAFLEFTSPAIKEQIKELVDMGNSEIVIFPYFLSAGKHVTTDLPNELQNAKKQYPQVRFVLKNHLGSLEDLSGFILSRIH